MLIELPCGLLLDGEVYDHVIISELKGKQQNYLLDMDLVAENMGHIPKLLEDLATDYQTKAGKPAPINSKDAVSKLASADVEVILLKIREATYGKVFGMPVTCPQCGKDQLKKVDLDVLEIKSLVDKKVRTVEIDLPKTKIKAEVKLLYLSDLFDLFQALKSQNKKLYTESLRLSISKLGDKTNVTSEDMENIPVTDLQRIEDAFVSLRASIDNIIIHDCDKCKHEFETPLPVVDPNFFAQSRTPTI